MTTVRVLRVGLRALVGFGLLSLGWMLTATVVGAILGLPMLSVGIDLLTDG